MNCRLTTGATFAFETRMPERVLLVDGEPGPSVFGNETYYLETALRLSLPGEQAKEASRHPVRADANRGCRRIVFAA